MKFKKYFVILFLLIITCFFYFLLLNQSFQAKNRDNFVIVKVFFGNKFKNPQAEDCTLVYPVNRFIVKTPRIAQKTLEELLKGPTLLEKEEGYFSSINPNVKINSLNIKNGIAYVDFDETLEKNVGGSCRVTAIRSEIVTTLKQFPTIQDVVISINGRTEDILQP